MSEELVKRLRLWGEHGLTNTLSDLVEAADRIEALTAEVARLKALLGERDKFIVSRDLWGAFTDTLGDEA